MELRFCRLLLGVLILLLIAAPVFADLDDFGDAVDEERRRNEEENREDDGNEIENDDESEGREQGFLDVQFTLAGLLWYSHNASTWYADYPYEGTGGIHAVGHDEKMFDRNPDFRQYRFTLETSDGIFLQDGDSGYPWAIPV